MKYIALVLLCCIIPLGCATTAFAEEATPTEIKSVAAAADIYAAKPPQYQLQFKIDPLTKHLIIRDSNGRESDVTVFIYMMRQVEAMMKQKVAK